LRIQNIVLHLPINNSLINYSDTMESYINQYGTKTSIKLDKIKDRAWEYVYGDKGYNSNKFYTKKYAKLLSDFQKESDAIGGVDYNLGDSLA